MEEKLCIMCSVMPQDGCFREIRNLDVQVVEVSFFNA